MKKIRVAIFCLLAAMTLALTSCETLMRAFAEQTGRNAADALWDRLINKSVETSPVRTTYYDHQGLPVSLSS